MASGYELTTAITNIFIVIMALFAYLKLCNNKKVDFKYKLLFILLAIAGLMGIIIHGITWNKLMHKILWMILASVFGILINLIMIIFLNKKYKKLGIKEALYLAGIVYLVLFIELLFGTDIIPTFTGYALVCIIIITISIIKNGIKNMLDFSLGILMQYIGGLFIIFRSFYTFPIINHNGIYHIFLCFTIFFFYRGVKKLYN